jgi:hypothetical protein
MGWVSLNSVAEERVPQGLKPSFSNGGGAAEAAPFQSEFELSHYPNLCILTSGSRIPYNGFSHVNLRSCRRTTDLS